VDIAAGDRLVVRLSSTYWTVSPPASNAVLRAEGPAIVATPSAATSHCVPGSGCGTVTAVFVARTPGRAVVTAQRTSCGEALRCTDQQGSYRLTVVVR